MKTLLFLVTLLFCASLSLNIYYLSAVGDIEKRERFVQTQMDTLQAQRSRFYDIRSKYVLCLNGLYLTLEEVADKFMTLSEEKNFTANMNGSIFLDYVFANSEVWKNACYYDEIMRELDNMGFPIDKPLWMDSANWDTIAWVIDAKELELRGIKAGRYRPWLEKYNEDFPVLNDR